MCADEALRHCQRETRHQCLCSTHVNNCSRKQSAGTARWLCAGPTPYGVGPSPSQRAVPYGSCCTRPGWVVHLTVTSSGHTRRCRDAWMSRKPSRLLVLASSDSRFLCYRVCESSTPIRACPITQLTLIIQTSIFKCVWPLTTSAQQLALCDKS